MAGICKKINHKLRLKINPISSGLQIFSPKKNNFILCWIRQKYLLQRSFSIFLKYYSGHGGENKRLLTVIKRLIAVNNAELFGIKDGVVWILLIKIYELLHPFQDAQTYQETPKIP